MRTLVRSVIGLLAGGICGVTAHLLGAPDPIGTVVAGAIPGFLVGWFMPSDTSCAGKESGTLPSTNNEMSDT